MASQEYLDFEIEIGPGIGGREYPLTVIRSPGGEAHERLIFPFDELALASRLKDLQIALLRSGGTRRQALTSEEQTVKDFGEKLFAALITGETRSRYDVSKQIAAHQKKGLRVKLRIQPPELASLPWEFLYDPHETEYICLSAKTPLVRYIELPRVIQPITIVPPLRILGVTASPRGLGTLDVENEKLRVEVALEDLIERKQIDITWQDHATWRDLQRLMRSSRGPWHILHFIGHGGFNRESDEGFIALENESGETYRLPATQLGRLIADHSTLRLAILNSCDGAQGGNTDIFSSTASLLVRRGLPAVLAMQYEITDRAAIEFARGFYEAIADGLPVDAATVEARKSVSLGVNNTVEWGTPVLFMRAPDGVLFKQIAPEKVAEIAARESAEKEAAEKAALEKAKREAAEKESKEKAAQEKARQEAAKKDAQEKTEREAAEKAALEKAKQEAAERAAKEKVLREKEKRDAAEKAARARAAQRAALARKLSEVTTALKPVIRKSVPVLSVVGLFAIVGFLLWFGLKARSSDVIYFTSNRDGKAEIYKLTGSQATRLTTTSGNAENWSPSAAASGAVYFTSNRDGKEEIYKLSGSQTTRLTTTGGNAKSWSPSAADAGVIYFTSNRDGKAEIYKLSGSQTTRLTFTDGNAESWAPMTADAGVVYFVSDRDGKAEIYKLSDGETTRLTYTDGNAESWAPAAADAGVVYFVSNRDGKAEIYKLSGEGTTRLTFTDGSAESWSPLVVSPGVVYFTSNRDGKAEIYKLSEGKTTRLTTTDGSAQSWLTVLNQRLKGVISIYKY